MKRARILGIVLVFLPPALGIAGSGDAQTAGPAKGSLVICGGGTLGPEIWGRFIDLAGGRDAPIAVIPTAKGADRYDESTKAVRILREAGARNTFILHATSREVADSEPFVEPLRRARGVWIGGGRQWRLADVYLDTRTERELDALLGRGGVIGGSSAGASIQASYLVRGDPRGNRIMMAAGHERGFGLLSHSAIDQHWLTRHREQDLLEVVKRFPNLLGIGIDEGTAIVVRGDRFEVVGKSKVAVYGHLGVPLPPSGYLLLSPGDRFDLKRRQVETPTAMGER